MVDFSIYSSPGKENSELQEKVETETTNSLSMSLLNCPTVLSGMSHEMRTHMNAIVAFSFLMNKNGSDEKEREEFSNQILSSCEQLISLFDGFLDSAIIDSGITKAEPGASKSDNIINELVTEFRAVTGKECHKEIEIISENRFSAPVEIFIDSFRILKVIRTLFQNSLKNTKSGYIKIGQYFKEDKITFYVLDSGQGYFKCKEFLQTEDMNESLEKYNDTISAINLTLAKKLVQLMGGSIWIECNGLTGSGIYFTIPVKVVESTDVSIHKYQNSMIAI